MRFPTRLPGNSRRERRLGGWLIPLAVLVCNWSPNAVADATGDFLVFPALEWRDDRNADPPGYGAGDEGDATAYDGYGTGDEWFASLDLFATAEIGDFRFLGEWFLTEDSQEIQRLQLGWHFGEDETVWLGRFHTPLGYWNTAFHHGTYLQTSISRPGIVEFEGGEGPLPTHFTGLLWEGSVPAGAGALHYSLGLGAGPVLNGRLDPFDVAHPDDHDHSHESGAIVNVTWRPVPHGRNQLGASVGRADIVGPAAEFEETEMTLYGVYANWNWDRTRLLGAWFRVSNEFSGLPAPDEDFSAAYLQGEYQLNHALTAYARVETSDDARSDSLYLGRFETFITERTLAGLRFDLTERQALTLEVSTRESFGAEADRINVQWSAYFP